MNVLIYVDAYCVRDMLVEELMKRGHEFRLITQETQHWDSAFDHDTSRQHDRFWADALIVAPISRTTIFKFANGVCDNVVTNLFRCWEAKKPVLLVPHMTIEELSYPLVTENTRKIMRLNHPEVRLNKPLEPYHIRFVYSHEKIPSATIVVDELERMFAQKTGHEPVPASK